MPGTTAGTDSQREAPCGACRDGVHRGHLSECLVDLFEECPQLGEAFGAEAPPEALLEFGDDLAGDRVDLGAAGGGPDELRATVGGIGKAFDVAVPLEMRNQLGHRLLGDLRTPSELADRGAFGIEELQDIAVWCAYGGVAASGETLVNQLVAPTHRFAHEHAQIPVR